MAHRLEITSQARRQMKALPRRVVQRIDTAICRLAEDPRPAGCKKLSLQENAWRIRVGDYRVIYEVHDKVLVVVVVRVDHRSTVYR